MIYIYAEFTISKEIVSREKLKFVQVNFILDIFILGFSKKRGLTTQSTTPISASVLA